MTRFPMLPPLMVSNITRCRVGFIYIYIYIYIYLGKVQGARIELREPWEGVLSGPRSALLASAAIWEASVQSHDSLKPQSCRSFGCPNEPFYPFQEDTYTHTHQTSYHVVQDPGACAGRSKSPRPVRGFSREACNALSFCWMLFNAYASTTPS